jgi:hypothetical protein
MGVNNGISGSLSPGALARDFLLIEGVNHDSSILFENGYGFVSDHPGTVTKS